MKPYLTAPSTCLALLPAAAVLAYAIWTAWRGC